MAEFTKETKYKLSVVLSQGGSAGELQKVLASLFAQEGISADKVQLICAGNIDEETNAVLQDYVSERGDSILFISDPDRISDAIAGEYVVFSNGFDVWEQSALGRLTGYLDEHEEIDVVLSGKANYFDKKQFKDPALVKEKAAVIDANKKNAGSAVDIRLAVIRRGALKKCVPYAGVETLDVMSMLVMAINEKGKYGVVPSALMLVRDDWFNTDLEGLQAFAEEIKGDSVKTHGKVTDYVCSVLCRLANIAIRQKKYEDDVRQCLQDVPDRCIYDTQDAKPFEIRYAYQLKYGRDIYPEAQLDDRGRLMFHDTCVFDTVSFGSVVVKLIDLDPDNKRIVLEGFTDLTLVDENVSLILRDREGNCHTAEIIEFPVNNEYGYNGEIIYHGVRFVLSVPAVCGASYEFIVRYRSMDKDYKTWIKLGKFSRLNEKTNTSYFVKSGYLISYRNGRIEVAKNSWAGHLKHELRYMKEVYRQGKRNVLIYRLLYWLSKPFFSGKPVWIVVDRPHVAGDNGEHFFRYLMSHDRGKTVRPCFLIKKNSPDYERIKKIGPVLEYGSPKHRIKTLHASKIIASAGNDLALNPFGFNKKYYQDLYEYDFVYLRHGVSHNDQSSWLNRLIKNIKVLDTTSKYERDAILAGNYLYDESRVVLTGLPRYDNLYDDSKQKIAIMPTWRKDIEGPLLPHSSERAYIRDFKETEYYQFYNGLINDERLLQTMRKHGFTGVLYMHPAFEKQTKDFVENDVFQVGEGTADYQTVFKESNLMVTDYSSVAFDFAYLKKPVIYSQFDEEGFYANHVWEKGYFSYEKNGFGPVTRDLETTVLTLIDYIEQGCQMKQEYVDRVTDFFAYTDRNNCERVYKAIKSIQ